MSDIDKDRTNEQDRNQGEDGYVTIPSVTPSIREPAVGKTPSDATEGTNSGVSVFSGVTVPEGDDKPSEPITTPQTADSEHDVVDADDTPSDDVSEQAKDSHGDGSPVPPDGVARKPRHASETKGRGTHASSDGKRHDGGSKKKHGKGKHKSHHKHDGLLLAFSIAGFVMGGVALAVACDTANVVSNTPAYVTTTETFHTNAVPFENENVVDDDSDESYERWMQDHGLSDDDSEDYGRMGYVGVRIGDTDNGVTVVSVDASSPAAKAGIKKGDIIKSFGGITVTSADQFVRLVRATNSGTKVKVSVQHSGSNTESVTVTVGSMTASNGTSSSSSSTDGNQDTIEKQDDTNHDGVSRLDGSAIVNN